MKKLILILFFSISLTTYSQSAFFNNGNVQLHNDAKIGFHTNVINDGTITNNLGFAGFYSNDEVRTISGTNRPDFYNIEINTANNLELEVSLGITNELTFFDGKIITPRDDTSISLDFIQHEFYVGANKDNHVDGYASVKAFDDKFSFPIGDNNRLRPMILPTQTGNNLFKGAYFFENPNTPSIFSSFNTEERQNTLNSISNLEFWDLDGTTETNITLTWDSKSAISLLTKDIKKLRVVGWHKTNNKWEDLGNTFVEGDIYQGKITSISFIPDAYEVLTIGSVDIDANSTTSNFNYLISPNNDNANDGLVITEIKGYPYNKLSIYNRWGILVYRKKGYKNEFRGQSMGRSTIYEKEGLPDGTYFYMVEFGNTKKLEFSQKGWVYINR